MYLICGESLFDLFAKDADASGRLCFEACAGGSLFNVAIGISRLGGKSALLTGISNDLLGQRLVKILQKEAVCTKYLVRSEHPTALSLVGVDDLGQPQYRFYGVDSADRQLKIHEIPEPINQTSSKISALHFGSYSMVVKPVADTFSQILRECGSRFVSVDPNVRLNVEPEIEIWQQRITEYAGRANLFKISMEDMDALYPGVSPETKAAEWMSQGVELVVITNGGEAIEAWTAQGVFARVSPPRVKMVDSVGAGDSFLAALLAKLASDKGNDASAEINSLNEKSLSMLLSYCAKAAAITCERKGADLPHLSDL